MSGHTRRTFVRAVLWLSPLALFLVGVGSAIDEFPVINADPAVARCSAWARNWLCAALSWARRDSIPPVADPAWPRFTRPTTGRLSMLSWVLKTLPRKKVKTIGRTIMTTADLRPRPICLQDTNGARNWNIK